MSRTHVRRRQNRRSTRAERGDSTVAPALALVGSFVLGMILEGLRTYVVILQSDWRADLLVILVTAWLCIALLERDGGHDLPRRAGLVLGLLMFGSLVMHHLLGRI